MRKIVNDKGDEGPMEKLGAAPVAKDGVKVGNRVTDTDIKRVTKLFFC